MVHAKASHQHYRKTIPRDKALTDSAARHAEAGLKHIASGNFEGEHWLASFAVYLYSTPE